MPLVLPDHWVWDFWFADDGEQFHVFFLHAPKSLKDPERRHRHARIGHATSPDLRNWHFLGAALGPGVEGAFDATATWTGSIIRGPDGLWRMFYTGSRFLSAGSAANIESIGLALSPDLAVWAKVPGPILRADARWYETLGSSSWPEEAWRDPWVFPDPSGVGWHMLVTARANRGPDFGRGVIGHAVSADLRTWHARPPLSEPQSGFAHLEVPQLIEVEGRRFLIFCCNSPRLANERTGSTGGIWAAPALGSVGPFDISAAYLLLPERYYAGRAVQDRSGEWMLMGFEMLAPGGGFPGIITDPMPLRVDSDGRLAVAQTANALPMVAAPR